MSVQSHINHPSLAQSIDMPSRLGYTEMKPRYRSREILDMGLLSFIRKRYAERTFQRLYNYWLEKDVPFNNRPNILRGNDNDKEGTTEQTIDEDFLPREPLYREAPRTSRSRDTVHLRLPMRYVFIGVGLIAFLLVALAIVSTVLAMQSC